MTPNLTFQTKKDILRIIIRQSTA